MIRLEVQATASEARRTLCSPRRSPVYRSVIAEPGPVCHLSTVPLLRLSANLPYPFPNHMGVWLISTLHIQFWATAKELPVFEQNLCHILALAGYRYLISIVGKKALCNFSRIIMSAKLSSNPVSMKDTKEKQAWHVGPIYFLCFHSSSELGKFGVLFRSLMSTDHSG